MNGFVASMSYFGRSTLTSRGKRVLDIPPGNGEQDIVEACGCLDVAADAPCPKLGNLGGKESGPRRLLKHYFMASRQGLPREGSATVPAPIVPNFMMRLLVFRENQ